MTALKNTLKLMLMVSIFTAASIFGTGCQADKNNPGSATNSGVADQLVVYAPAGSSKLLSRLQEHHFNIVQLETQSESARLVKSLIGASSGDFFVVLNPKFNRVVTSAAITNDTEWSEVDKVLENIEKVNESGPKHLPRLQPEKPNTVRLAIFSDFQCPFCKRFDDKIEQWKTKYGDKLDISFMQFPLPMHPMAFPAAVASECARSQGKFDAYRVKLFGSQEQMKAGKEPFKSIAKTLGLDKTEFENCLHSTVVQEKVKTDVLFGNYVAIKGTPTFFINGELIDGLSETQIVQKLEAAMH